MNINDKDLNHLVLFTKIWEERNLHKAAERLNLSQPAISHALKRMRDQFDDPMFVRSSRGVTPTDFSISIADEVFNIVQRLEILYQKNDHFNPSECERNLSLAVGDYFSLTLLTPFFEQLEKEAPKVKVTCYPDSELYRPSKFEQGDIHLGLTGFFDINVKQGFKSQLLINDRITCVANKKHPIFKQGKDLDSYLNSEHIFVSVEGNNYGVVDKKLGKKKRRVSKIVPTFFAAGSLLEKTHSILTGPHGVNMALAKTHNLQVFETPFKEIKFPFSMYWHQRTDEDDFLVWIREQLILTARKIKY